MDEKFPLALPQGTVLAGQYIIDKALGQGGFGITYMATDHKTNEKVAVKEFFPDTLATRTESVTVTAYTGERGESFTYGKKCFLHEAETLAEFIGNKNIVRIHSYFEENGTAYFVMDFVEGVSFDQYIKDKGGKVSYEDAEKILVNVIDALAAVHSKGIVHRDVTPDNIYITKEGDVKLLDFGAARYSLGDKSRSLDVVLKHGFAPKEQYTRHGKQGPFTDVYALGASFYFAITGKRPPDSIDRIEEDDLVPPSVLGVSIPAEKEEAILKAMAVQPNDRFQTMDEFKKALMEGMKPVASPMPAQVNVQAQQTQPVNNMVNQAQPAAPNNIPPTGAYTQTVAQGATPNVPQMPYTQTVAQGANQIPYTQMGQAPGYVQPGATPYAQPKKSKGWLIALIAAIVVILAGGGITAAVLINSGNSDSRSERDKDKDKDKDEDKDEPEVVEVSTPKPTATTQTEPDWGEEETEEVEEPEYDYSSDYSTSYYAPVIAANSQGTFYYNPDAALIACEYGNAIYMADVDGHSYTYYTSSIYTNPMLARGEFYFLDQDGNPVKYNKAYDRLDPVSELNMGSYNRLIMDDIGCIYVCDSGFDSECPTDYALGYYNWDTGLADNYYFLYYIDAVTYDGYDVYFVGKDGCTINYTSYEGFCSAQTSTALCKPSGVTNITKLVMDGSYIYYVGEKDGYPYIGKINAISGSEIGGQSIPTNSGWDIAGIMAYEGDFYLAISNQSSMKTEVYKFDPTVTVSSWGDYLIYNSVDYGISHYSWAISIYPDTGIILNGMDDSYPTQVIVYTDGSGNEPEIYQGYWN